MHGAVAEARLAILPLGKGDIVEIVIGEVARVSAGPIVPWLSGAAPLE
jgi:hypothetical protein